MKVNFEIIENYSIKYSDRHIDVHNNFDLHKFEYDIENNSIIFNFIKTIGNRAIKEKLKLFKIIHNKVNFLQTDNPDKDSKGNDRITIGDITFFPSSSREVNDSILPKNYPDENDDIIYFFESGQYIRINCEEIFIEI